MNVRLSLTVEKWAQEDHFILITIEFSPAILSQTFHFQHAKMASENCLGI